MYSKHGHEVIYRERLEGRHTVMHEFWSWAQHGALSASWWVIVLYTLAVAHITVLSVTIYLHRYSAHRSLALHPGLQHAFRFWIWLTTGMITREWTAVHRRHHAHCETERDPHSPRVVGLRKVLLEGAELYRQGADADTVARFGKGTPDDWIERRIYSRWPMLGIALMLVINLALFGVIGLSVWGVQMLWIPLMAAGVVNGIGHYWGYRNFECPDAATNIVPLGLLIGGEELHNNHHTYPNSAKFSVKRWEFDLGWLWIRVFSALRLAQPLSTGPVVAHDPTRDVIDDSTLWAVFNDRFQVMAIYAELVIAPLVEEEYQRADQATRSAFRRAKSVLCREATLTSERQRAQISHLLHLSPLLHTTYELRQQLAQLCSRRSGDMDERLRALTQWCRDAEATGIDALQEFVQHLKSYTMPVAVVRR